MPIDPNTLAKIGSGYGTSPTQQVTPENLLMAAAEMHKMGRLAPDPQPSMPSSKDKAPVKPRRGGHRGMRVVK